jgi:hypothetical protein
MMFIKEYPALLDKDHMPVNYRIFKAGIITMSRNNAIEQLKLSRAMRAGQASAEDFQRWIDEKIAQAGMPVAPQEE